MADTTPTNKSDLIIVQKLQDQIGKLEMEVAKRQKALVRIYRKFGSDMHPCQLDLTTEERMAWMQELARIASAMTVPVETAVDKPAKIVGVGVAGEKNV